jgi:hypothetical protein
MFVRFRKMNMKKAQITALFYFILRQQKTHRKKIKRWVKKSGIRILSN